MSYVQTMAKALRHYGAVNPTAKKPPRIQVRAPRAGGKSVMKNGRKNNKRIDPFP